MTCTWIVAVGSPWDGGVEFFGPFASRDEAVRWASHVHRDETDVIEVTAP